MNFFLTFLIPPSKMTFELVQRIQDYAAMRYIDVSFDGYTGRFTFTDVPTPKEFDVLVEMEDIGALPVNAGSEGLRDFVRFFGRTAKVNYDAMRVYCRLCEGGNVW